MLSFVVLELLCIISISTAKNTYMIVSPGTVRAGQNYDISVSILDASAPVTVTAYIMKGAATAATGSASFTSGTPDILSIKVPATVTAGSYKLRVFGTGGLHFRNETTLNFESKSMSIFVQTDRAIYKPGQTVRMRIFAVDSDLLPYKGKFDVEVMDANKNKLKRWKGLQDPSGIVSKDMVMSTQPVLGDWVIRVTAVNQKKEKTFTLAEYVLPKFEVLVNLPSFQLISDKLVKGTVEGKFTFGKSVEGHASIRLRMKPWNRPWRYTGPEPVIEQNKLQLVDGKVDFSIPLKHVLEVFFGSSANVNSILSNGYRSLVVEANVTNSLTNQTRSGKGELQFYRSRTKFEWLSSNSKNFKPGLKYTAYAKVVEQDGRPLSDKSAMVEIRTEIPYRKVYPWGFTSRTVKLQKQRVPKDGIIQVDVEDIPINATGSIILKISDPSVKASYYSTKTLYVSKANSPSNNFLQASLKTVSPKVGQMVDIDLAATEMVKAVYYEILSKGKITESSHMTMSANSGTLSLLMTNTMSPSSRIVVYYIRSDGEVVTDSINFKVDGAFKNKVSIAFSTGKAEPGDKVDVKVSASPNSFVGLLAVDQSVLLLKSGNDITQDQVYEELKQYDTKPIQYNPWSRGGFPGRPIGKRSIWWGWYYPVGGQDAASTFRNAGVIVFTDNTIYSTRRDGINRPVPLPGGFGGIEGGRGGGAGGIVPTALPLVVSTRAPGIVLPGSGSKPSSGLKSVSKVRQKFPETWLWTNITTRPDGKGLLQTVIPDTITSWVASAFSMSNQDGLGVASSTAKVTVFRPFFVTLNLPYSVVRSEEVVLQAIVFNYLSKDTDVRVTLKGSSGFHSLEVDKNGNTKTLKGGSITTVSVPAGKAKSVFFPILPSMLGKIDIEIAAQSSMAADAVKRQLLVEAEGVEKEYNQALFVDLTKESTYKTTLPIALPNNVVSGSQHAVISVVGDIMGPTLQGLDRLIRLPYGCGEQNMLNFAPNIFVSDYLAATKQFMSAIESKAVDFMEKGYQRELKYQRNDGSFSAFGSRDKSGSMWLTAFVVKSFHQAKPYIFIDDELLSKAIHWMIRQQLSTGAFPEPGRVIHKAMQGGSATGISLTSYVLTTLLENKDLKIPALDLAVSKATKYLEGKLSQLNDPYSLAISSYALTLAKHSAAKLFSEKLEKLATSKDGMKYWSAPDTEKPSKRYWYPPHRQSKAKNIEMTSYALLTYTLNKKMPEGLPILRWVISQRNANGGFSSTQDTIVALQALTHFASMIYSKSLNMDINVISGSSINTFKVNEKNAAILQRYELSTLPQSIDVSATGSGMAIFQLAVSYNIEDDLEQPSFAVVATVVRETTSDFTLQVCTRWLKPGASGMAIKEIGIPTGFEADEESIVEIQKTAKKVEVEERKVVVYFDEIGATNVCLSLDVRRVGLVAKSKPAAIKVYDYYEPDNQKTEFYLPKSLKDATLCDVCGKSCSSNCK